MPLEKYDVTAERKSIYQDFQDMTDKLGIEIIKEQIGRETYYHVDAREFELAEVKLLIDAIQSSKFITQTKSRELIGKIKGRDSKYCAEKGYVAAADASVAMCEQTYKIANIPTIWISVRPAALCWREVMRARRI